MRQQQWPSAPSSKNTRQNKHTAETYIYSTISCQKLNYSIHLCARALNRDAGRHRQCVLPGAVSVPERQGETAAAASGATRRDPISVRGSPLHEPPDPSPNRGDRSSLSVASTERRSRCGPGPHPAHKAGRHVPRNERPPAGPPIAPRGLTACTHRSETGTRTVLCANTNRVPVSVPILIASRFPSH